METSGGGMGKSARKKLVFHNWDNDRTEEPTRGKPAAKSASKRRSAPARKEMSADDLNGRELDRLARLKRMPDIEEPPRTGISRRPPPPLPEDQTMMGGGGMKAGGRVRGCGAATKGFTKGKMR